MSDLPVIPNIHVTGRQSFKRCRLQFQLREKERLIPAQWKHIPFIVGDIFHAGLDAYYNNWNAKTSTGSCDIGAETLFDTYQKALYDLRNEEADASIIEELENQWPLLDSMYCEYVAECQDKDKSFTGVQTQVRLSQTINTIHGPVNLVGTLDALVRIGDQLWVMEHKTAASFKDDELIILDDQANAYMWLVEKIYGSVAGVIYNQVRKKLPPKPTPIANGSRLSAVVKDTTYAVYLAAIQEYGFKVADYEDILYELQHKNNYCKRAMIPKSKPRLQQFDEYLPYELALMIDPDCVYFPTQTWDCARSCDYYLICKTHIDGGDTDDIKQFYYRVNENHRALENDSDVE